MPLRADDGLQGTLPDGAVHWFCDAVCCSWLYLCWTNGVESLWMASTICLTTCYRESGQRGDFMVDVENVNGCLDEYLTDGNFPVGAGVLDPPDPRHVDLAEAALNHVYQLNGRNIDQTVGETEADERAKTTRGVQGAHVEGKEEEMEEDDKMEVDETPAEKRARYMSSSQEEVWAETHYSGLAWDDYERMAAFSRANRLHLENALETLRMKRNIAEVDGNWEEASNYGPAMAEIESLMDNA